MNLSMFVYVYIRTLYRYSVYMYVCICMYSMYVQYVCMYLCMYVYLLTSHGDDSIAIFIDYIENSSNNSFSILTYFSSDRRYELRVRNFIVGVFVHF